MAPSISRRRRGRALFVAATATVGALVLPATAASAGTTPPNSTPQERVDALIEPSLVFISTTVTGTVDVPFTDGTTQQYSVPASNDVGSYCSGAIVSDDGTILTAGHCFDPNEYVTQLIDNVYQYLQQQNDITSGFTQSDAEDPQNGWTVETSSVNITAQVALMASAASVGTASALPATLVYDEPVTKGDIALLKVTLPGGVSLPALKVAGDTPPVGTQIVSAGFPGSVTFNADSSEATDLTPTYTGGSTANSQTISGGSAPFTAVTSIIQQGMSGGPTVDMTGQVIGTNSQIESSGQGDESLSVATDTEHVKSILESNNVDNTLSATDQDWRTGLADYWKGLYREAAALFTDVVDAQPNNPQAHSFYDKAVQSESLETSGSSAWLLPVIIAVVVVVLAAIGGWLFLRRRRKSSSGKPMTPGASSQYPAGG
jgi:S1-C subfamily serine protease